MAEFASDQFSSEFYTALHWGLPAALTFPAINPVPGGANPAVGWYASDDGLVRRRGRYHRKDSQDFRTYYLDVSPLTNIRQGDTLGDASDIHLVAFPNTISAGNFAIGTDQYATRIFFTLEAGEPNTLYCIRVQFKLTSGTVLARVVRVAVDEYT